jgi:hypothetical protein
MSALYEYEWSCQFSSDFEHVNMLCPEIFWKRATRFTSLATVEVLQCYSTKRRIGLYI